MKVYEITHTGMWEKLVARVLCMTLRGLDWGEAYHKS